jgi:hypothetical protein
MVCPCLICPYQLQSQMRHALICLLLVMCSAKAEVLFSDEGKGHGYIFESDQRDVEATVSRDHVIELASTWAAGFYDDYSLDVADVEIRIDPLRSWLVTFKKPGTDEEFYAAVLPDGTIAEPQDETKV